MESATEIEAGMCASTSTDLEVEGTQKSQLQDLHPKSYKADSHRSLRSHDKTRNNSRDYGDNNGDSKDESENRSDTFSEPTLRKDSLVQSDKEHEDECNHRNSSFILQENHTSLNADDVDEIRRGTNSNDASNNDLSQAKFETTGTFCGEIISLPAGVCQGSSDFAEQMDIFMRCQHPMDILGMFQEDDVAIGVTDDGSGQGGRMVESQTQVSVNRSSGYHAIPRSCEYCGSPDIELCKDNEECDRPKSFFPREIPPFCTTSHSKWGVSGSARKDRETEINASNEDDIGGTMACSAWI